MDDRPFWEDDPFPQIQTKESGPTGQLSRFIISYRTLVSILMISILALVLWLISYWLFASWLVLMAGLVVFVVFRRRSILARKDRALQIQQAARALTAAEQIGSAVHVAGHPRLEREQPVVLALTGTKLVLYPYQKAVPLDEIPIAAIQSVHTVVYDNERIPHTEVIDSTAQALQIAFLREGKAFSCLFRQMRAPRPIDWFHAIQQARLQAQV